MPSRVDDVLLQLSQRGKLFVQSAYRLWVGECIPPRTWQRSIASEQRFMYIGPPLVRETALNWSLAGLERESSAQHDDTCPRQFRVGRQANMQEAPPPHLHTLLDNESLLGIQ